MATWKTIKVSEFITALKNAIHEKGLKTNDVEIGAIIQGPDSIVMDLATRDDEELEIIIDKNIKA